MKTAMRPISQYSADGSLIKSYPSVYVATRDSGVPKRIIHLRLNREIKKKSKYPYVWKYDEAIN